MRRLSLMVTVLFPGRCGFWNLAFLRPRCNHRPIAPTALADRINAIASTNSRQEHLNGLE